MQNLVEEKLRVTLAKLADNGTKKISVAALCEKAGISRASFYIYYSDLDDLINKTREYIINKLYEQLKIIVDIKSEEFSEETHMIFDDVDIALLKGFTGKNVYWEFAIEANNIIFPRYEKKMKERWGEEYYNNNKEKFEFLINGGIATFYFDLLNYDKAECVKNMKRTADIVRELLTV